MPRKFDMIFPGGARSTVFLKKFEKKDVYGTKKYEKRNKDGKSLDSAWLTWDGAHVIPKGGTSSFYLDEDGKYVPNNEKYPVNNEGEPLSIVPSIYNNEVAITDIITLEELLMYDLDATYVLQPDEDGDTEPLLEKCNELLEKKLFYKFQYAYYDTAFPSDAILIPMEDELVIGLGTYVEPIFTGPTTNIEELFKDIEIDEEEEAHFEEAW